jgi:hypothetical protein
LRQRRLKLWLHAKARRKANDLEPTTGSINCFAKIYTWAVLTRQGERGLDRVQQLRYT